MAKAYNEIHGFDYTDTSSLVANIHSIRLPLAIAAPHELKVHHLDVSAAYLNGELDTVIYMEQLDDFKKSAANKVCKLKKAIYGLK